VVALPLPSLRRGDGDAVSDHPDLAALLADPARAAEVPAKDRQAVLDALAVHEGRYRLARELLAVRLAVPVITMTSGATAQAS
jgi:hypothetical protein